MPGLIRRIHIYAGLLVFSQFLVYGIAGLVATLQSSFIRPQVPITTRTEPFEVRPGETQKQIADRVYEQIRPALSRPVPEWALARTAGKHLRLDFYNVNGIVRAIVLEDRKQIRVENIRQSTGLFLVNIHGATPGDLSAPGLVTVWAVWNEVGIWALLFFCVSGAYLWLSTRPGLIWAWVALGAGALAFTALWVVLR